MLTGVMSWVAIILCKHLRWLRVKLYLILRQNKGQDPFHGSWPFYLTISSSFFCQKGRREGMHCSRLRGCRQKWQHFRCFIFLARHLQILQKWNYAVVRLTLNRVLKTPVDKPGVSLTMKVKKPESEIVWVKKSLPTEFRIDKTTYMKK